MPESTLKNPTAIKKQYPKLIVTAHECKWCETVWEKLYRGESEGNGDACKECGRCVACCRDEGACDMVEMLEPGNYSVFVLSDDQTWEQPTYRIDKPMSEHDFRMAAETDCGGFISFGVDEDTECPEDNVRKLP